MNPFIRNIQEEPTKPLDQQEEIDETEDETEEVEEPTEEATEDRTAYNCHHCHGEGLVWDEGSKRHERCTVCQGTGKVEVN